MVKIVNKLSCEINIHVPKGINGKVSYAMLKFLKLNQDKYHLNIDSICSGGVICDDSNDLAVTLFITYCGTYKNQTNDQEFYDTDSEIDDLTKHWGEYK